jgi:hypothetical protein
MTLCKLRVTRHLRAGFVEAAGSLQAAGMRRASWHAVLWLCRTLDDMTNVSTGSWQQFGAGIVEATGSIHSNTRTKHMQHMTQAAGFITHRCRRS